jgi:uncharacterized protein YndB with AHSA1/START domain
MPTLETAAPALMLEQTRIIRAPRASVYEAWTNPEILMKWFGPAKMHCPSATLDVREGGAYQIDVVPDVPPPATPGESCQERRSSAVGNYTKVVPNELLQFTWSPNWNLGEESLVTVSFQDARGGTQITIRHERFNTEASRDGHNNGWAGCLDKLDAMAEQL